MVGVLLPLPVVAVSPSPSGSSSTPPADDVRLPLMSTQDAKQKSLTMLKSELSYWRTAMTTMISDSSSVEGADHVGAGSDGSADSLWQGAAAGDAACDGSADGLGCDQTGNATNFHNAVAKAVRASVQLVGQGRAWQFGDPVPSTPASEWALSRGWGASHTFVAASTANPKR